MADPTRSSSGSRRGNPRAGWSLACGVLAVAVVPLGILAARETKAVTLINSAPSILVAVLLGISAVVLGRRARERVEITLGRAWGTGTARLGRLLGLLGILVAATAALALAFYGLLVLFAA